MVIRLPHYLLLLVLSCCWVFVPLVPGRQGACEDTLPSNVSTEQFALGGQNPDFCPCCWSCVSSERLREVREALQHKVQFLEGWCGAQWLHPDACIPLPTSHFPHPAACTLLPASHCLHSSACTPSHSLHPIACTPLPTSHCPHSIARATAGKAAQGAFAQHSPSVLCLWEEKEKKKNPNPT